MERAVAAGTGPAFADDYGLLVTLQTCERRIFLEIKFSLK